MKKTLTLFLFTCLFSIVQATEIHTVNTTAGNLATDASAYLATVTDLTVTGTIDARDFKTMRDDMPLLANLNLSGATIAAGTNIPGTNGTADYPANEIPQCAFSASSTYAGKASLTTISMPLSVTSIGANAFKNCSGLTALAIPASVTNIGDCAFTFCRSLTGSLTIPSSVTSIGLNAFADCRSLTGSVTIPASVTSIGSSAFMQCSALIIVDIANPNYSSEDGVLFDKNKAKLIQCPISKTGSYTIPSSVTSIGAYAFYDCSGLTGSLTIPSSVTSIETSVFYNCSGLTGALTIPSSVTSIGNLAFFNCSKISSIKVYGTLPSSMILGNLVFGGISTSTCVLNMPIGTISRYAGETQWNAFITKKDELIVPMLSTQAVTNVGLTTATGNGTISGLGETNLTQHGVVWSTVTNPTVELSTKTTQGDASSTSTFTSAITGLTANTKYYLKAYVTNTTGTYYGDEVRFTTAAVALPPPTVTGISPTSGTTLGGTSVVITGTNLTDVIAVKFGSTNATSYMVSSPTKIIAVSPAGSTGAADVTVTTVWGTSAINTSDQFMYVPLPTITAISPTNGPIAGGTSVVITGVNFIGASAVKFGSTNATGYTVNSPTQITATSPAGAFGTTDITVTTGWGTSAISASGQFTYMGNPVISLSGVTAGGLAAAITAAGGDLATVTNLTVTGTIDARDFKTMRDAMLLLSKLDLSGATIAEYTGIDGTVLTINTTYPANEIPESAFDRPAKLTSIVMPSSITSIGFGAFTFCSNLTGSLTIPSSVTSIGSYAFYGCTGFTGSLTIPSSVISIGKLAFYNCSGLTGSLTIPSSVTSIGERAFQDCKGLIIVDVANPNYLSEDGVLFDKYKTKLIHYSKSKTGSYTIPSSVTSIEQYAFHSCSGFNGSLTIPASVTSIGLVALRWCSNISSIKVYGVTPCSNLGISAFDGTSTSGCILHVPVGTRDAYAAAPQWKDFMPNIIDDLVIAPAAITTVASAVTKTGAILNGSVNACGGSTAVTFEYGLTKSYGTTVTAAQSPVTGTLATAVSYALTGLTPNTTYHYRIVGVNSGGTTNGNDMKFTTIDIAPNISYVTPQSYVVGMPIVALTPTNTGGGVGLFTISPALPAGLSFDSATGTISGTPTAASAATTYTVSTANGGGSSTATISIAVKSPQTITFDALASKTYGDDTFDLAATSTSGLAVSYSSDNTAVARISGTTVIIVGAGTANITAAQAGDATNLAAVNVTQQLTVSKKALTVTAVAETKTYDGTTASTAVPTVGALASDDAINVAPTQVFDNINAGTNTLTASGLTIKRVVRDNAPAFDKPSVETIYKGRNTGVDMTGNYDISYVSAAGTINKQALTVTAATDTKTYDGTTVSNVAPAVGVLVVGDEINAAPTQVFDNINAGTNTLTASGLTIKKGSTDVTDNYDISYVAATGTINKLAVTVTAATDTKIYDGTTDSKVTPTVGTLAAGDEIATAPAQAFDNAVVGTTHVLTASGLTIKKGSTDVTDNYDISYVTATGTINKLAVTVTAATDTKIYDGTTDSKVTPTVGTLAVGDAIATAPTQAFDNAVVGTTHVLTASGFTIKKGSTGVTDNYDISYVTATGTINKLAVTVTAAIDTKIYDGTTDSKVTPTVGTLAVGDAIATAPTQAFDNAVVGTTHVLTASGLTIKKGSTDVTDNYDISYVTATGTINKLAVTVTAAIDTKIYDGTTVSTAVPTVGTLATGDAISTAPAQAFDNAVVGTTHVLTASGLILKKDDADVTGNYDISYVTANGSITAKALTIAAPTVTPSKVYDGNKMAAITSMGTLSGVATGDEGNVTVSAVASYDNATVGTNKMITVVYSLGGNAAGNYTAPADFVVRGAEISSGTITLGPLSNPTPSPTSNNLVLFYNVVAGGPTQYKITYETAALAVGMQNVSYTALATANSDGTITITVPAGTKPGKYKGTLQMRNDSGAESTAYDFVMTVNIPTEYIVVKYKRVLVLDNNTRMFASYQWYKDGVAIEGATKQFYRDPKGLIGTYTVQAITTDGETLYSFPKELNLPINQKVTAYPSMVKADQTFTVEISDEDTDQNLAGAELSVYSERGVLVYKTTHVEKINTIKLSTTQGVYTGRVRMADGDAYQFKVVVAN